jgi:hypothetical protein
MKSLKLGAGLALAYAGLLFFFGDFTPYVGDPDQDIWITPPIPTSQFLRAVSWAVPFTAFSTLLFGATRRLLPGLLLLRLALVILPGLGALVYYFGPFKMLLGGEQPYLVHYELPRETDRLLISGGWATVIAPVVAIGVWISQAAMADVEEERPRGEKGAGAGNGLVG